MSKKKQARKRGNSRKRSTLARLETELETLAWREVQARLRRLEARIGAMTYVTLYLTVLAALDSKDAAAEVRLMQHEALKAAGHVKSLAEARMIDELASFYDAVLRYFRPDH